MHLCLDQIGIISPCCCFERRSRVCVIGHMILRLIWFSCFVWGGSDFYIDLAKVDELLSEDLESLRVQFYVWKDSYRHPAFSAG